MTSPEPLGAPPTQAHPQGEAPVEEGVQDTSTGGISCSPGGLDVTPDVVIKACQRLVLKRDICWNAHFLGTRVPEGEYPDRAPYLGLPKGSCTLGSHGEGLGALYAHVGAP